MKIYFVGIHNKPGMQPLDSRTWSGKVIDLVIAELGAAAVCVKTNLIDKDYMPELALTEGKKWHTRNTVQPGDIVVLLGGSTYINFAKHLLPENVPVVTALHPASFAVRRDRAEYVQKLVKSIQNVRCA